MKLRDYVLAGLVIFAGILIVWISSGVNAHGCVEHRGQWHFLTAECEGNSVWWRNP